MHSSVCVRGGGFAEGAFATWNGQRLPATFVNSTELNVPVPAELIATIGNRPYLTSPAAFAEIRVVNPGGAATGQAYFGIDPLVPRIYSVDPITVPAGSGPFTLTVKGANFSREAVVSWNGALPTTFVSASELRAQVSAQAISTPNNAFISVTNPPAVSQFGSNFLIGRATSPPLVISSLKPAEVAAGDGDFTVTVDGSGFFDGPISTYLGGPYGGTGSIVSWNGTLLTSTKFVSPTRLTATVPASLIAKPGVALVSVVHYGGQSNVLPVKVGSPPLTVTRIGPVTATTGDPAFTLTVYGYCFGTGAVVQWKNVALTTTFVTFGQLTATVPAALIAGGGVPSVSVVDVGAVSNALEFPIMPVITARGIVNAASWQPAIAPGSLIAIYGAGFADGDASAVSVPLPVKLNRVSVDIDSKPAPLFSVSPYEIVTQVPFETAVGLHQLSVAVGDVGWGLPQTSGFTVVPVAPGIMTTPLDPHHALAVNAPDGALNAAQHPIMPGGLVTVYITGQGALDNPIATGASSPAVPVSKPLAPVTITVGGQPADILFVGMAPALVGVLQLNFVVPNVSAGEQPLEVSIGDVPANVASLSVGGGE